MGLGAASVAGGEPTLTGPRSGGPRMTPTLFPPTPTLYLPFSHDGHQGRVEVFHSICRDAAAAGFDALPGFGAQPWVEGFPCLKAIVHQEGEGYQLETGWIQILHLTHKDGRADTDVVKVDKGPAFDHLPDPFGSRGYLPTFFDAPARGHRTPLLELADTFLCTLPMMSRKESIRALAGVRWGYEIHEKDSPILPTSPMPLKPSDWDSWLPMLRTSFSDWTFGSAEAP
jgi:hypothetical protein